MKINGEFCEKEHPVSESLKELTGLYSLSKTVRFELKPEPETKQRFEKWLEELQNVSDANEAIKNGNLFAKDKAIYKAYLALKPILDSIHEQFITLALQSEEAKKIDFSNYLEKYRNKAKLDDEEKKLRAEIGKLYSIPAKKFAVSKKNGKTNLKESKPYEVLTDMSILSYIRKNISSYSQIIPEEELIKYLEVFDGFFTYFSGYNINRENYYETKNEKATAVATRIIHENLPVFCNNIIRYEANKDLYSEIYNELKKNNRETKLKTESGEKEAAPITGHIFNIGYFSNCLSQHQIDLYNDIIGNNNLLINLYNQLHSKDSGFKRIQLFETLYKQIGCGKKKSLFLQLLKDTEAELTDEQRCTGEILSLEKLLSVVAEKTEHCFSKSEKKIGISTISDLLEYLENCNDWKGIYWNKAAVTSISNRFFMNWHDIADRLSKNSACASFNKNREEQIKLNDAVELDGLFAALNEEKAENMFKKTVLDEYKDTINLSESTSRNLIRILCFNTEKPVSFVLANKEKILTAKRMQEKSDSEEDIFVSTIKDWFDSIIDVFHFVRNFDVRETKVKGSILNSEIKEAVNMFLHSDDTPWFKWYDIVRNYLTKKPQDDVKDSMLKLNFGSSSLLGGWSDGQEKIKIATLLKHNDSTFLCILKDKKAFDTSVDNPIYKKDGNGSRLILRNLSFKTLAGKGFVSEFGTPYGDMGKENPAKAIKSLKEIIETKYIQKYPALQSILDKEYTDKKKFDADINEVLTECYICTFENVDWNLVQKKEENGDLFLFKIWGKDFSEKSDGHKNLQTLYWENILSENSMHQLCAGAEIFMRKPIENRKPYFHEANSIILCKKGVPDSIYEKVRLLIEENKSATEKEIREVIKRNSKEIISTANTDFDLSLLRFSQKNHKIIKDKRFYGENKYLFHCPIKLNYVSKAYKEPKYGYPEVNAKVNGTIQKSDDITYLGIDRGEKHLIYTCVVDKNGKILDCKSQNKIEETDYNQKLSEVAENRQKARKNWQTIGNISNLKEGYISNVVHSIVSQAIENPTYIVMEDLNTEMKRGRQKIEKQVYQKFEVALAKKLNFVVDKSAKEDELASVGKALQLTPPIANYQDIENKKQFGIMLYTRAQYTSVTDPLTGWRKTVYLKKGSEEFTKKQILENFSDIGFDGEDYFFEYVEKHAGKMWKMYSGKNGKSLPRFQNNKKLENDKAIWEPEAVDLVSVLNELFIDFSKEKSLREQILNNEHQLHKVSSRKETAWDSLRYVIDTIQHIRNTGKTEADSNFLYSPVRDENGIHFDSRNYHNNDLPADADANGAFNIARKGIIMDSHIKQWIKDGKKDKDLDLFVSDEEWDLWLLDKEKWNEMLSIFASRSAKEKRK